MLAKLPHVGQFFAHPGWLANFLMDGGMPKLPNVIVPGEGPMSLTDVGSALARSVVTWARFQMDSRSVGRADRCEERVDGR